MKCPRMFLYLVIYNVAVSCDIKPIFGYLIHFNSLFIVAGRNLYSPLIAIVLFISFFWQRNVRTKSKT